MYKEKGFSLSEVLITLGIIGIVAALTISPLIEKYDKKVTVTRLYKAYSFLSQAITRAEVDNGPISTWPLDWMYGSTFIDTYLKDYVKYNKISYATELILTRKGSYTNLKGEEILNHLWSDNYIETIDGTIYVFVHGAPVLRNGIYVIIDINGINKPNKYGKDVFCFTLQSKGLQPQGVNLTREELLAGSSNSCNRNSGGEYCAALIMLDNWQIKSDYPW